jgi:hypothetical protein
LDSLRYIIIHSSGIGTSQECSYIFYAGLTEKERAQGAMQSNVNYTSGCVKDYDVLTPTPPSGEHGGATDKGEGSEKAEGLLGVEY